MDTSDPVQEIMRLFGSEVERLVIDNETRRRFQFWKTMCETRNAYDVRVYLIQHVYEVLNGLKEFQFELREEIQAFINKQEKRWSN
jgi:hypothetical protein